MLKKSVDAWYNEVSQYDFVNPGFSQATGHFTCLVWKSSTYFGMGIAINTTTGAAYISMNTLPPGNILGQFQQNVLPLSINTVPVPVPVPVPVLIYQPIINKLNNIILYIESKQTKYYIISSINSVIHDIYYTSLSQTSKQNIINQLYNVNYLIQKNQNSTLIISKIQTVIQFLSQ